jgi:hypothetical protein
VAENQKYVVFKYNEACEYGAGERVDDAVVIRLQDMFAEHGLRAYAGSVITAMDIIREVGSPLTEKELLPELQKLADYFMDKADEASKITGKVPD